MDKRMMFGVCKRLLCKFSGKTNYYTSLFSPDEQKSIAAMAEQLTKKNVAPSWQPSGWCKCRGGTNLVGVNLKLPAATGLISVMKPDLPQLTHWFETK
jgi:hypothetical protein